MRAIIDVAIKEKRPIFLTYYDISKAFDNLDNADVTTILWRKGLKGKSWRLFNNLTENLQALAKTTYGPTRVFNMEIGGRQGSSLIGRMFSKLMDMISEELDELGEGIHLTEEFLIAVLLWVDNVTFAEGVEEQKLMLKRIDEFAIKHKIKWSPSKCNVMRIGRHNDSITEWKLGDVTIAECQSYI